MGRQDLSTLISVVSGTAAFVSVILAVIVAMAQRRRGNFDLARALHVELTTGAVMDARDRLTTFHQRGNPTQPDLDQLLRDYFTLLLCFERIEAGRYLLAGRWWSSGPLRYLDHLIRWHVLEWEASLAKVRCLLEPHLAEPLDDRDSRQALQRLHRVMLGGHWHLST